MTTQDPSKRRQLWRGVGWRWLWFLALCVVVLSVVERHTVSYALAIVKLWWQRWTWGSLFSLSADFCLIVMVASVVWPVAGLMIVTLLVAEKQRWHYLMLLIVAIFLVPFITDGLMWGSFPFIFDGAGVARLRMIPFVPWPSGRYGEY